MFLQVDKLLEGLAKKAVLGLVQMLNLGKFAEEGVRNCFVSDSLTIERMLFWMAWRF